MFSCGVLFFEIASRKIPFEEATDQLIIEGVRAGEREEIPDITSRSSANLIKWCWKQSPDERATAGQAAESLFDLAMGPG